MTNPVGGNSGGGTPPTGTSPKGTETPAAVAPVPAQDELFLTGEATKPTDEVKKSDEKPTEKVDAKPDEKKPDDKAKPQAVIELKLPDGYKAEDPAIKGLVELATAEKLTTEQTQKLFDRYIDVQKARDEQLVAAFKKERADWLSDAKKDQEIGGAKWNETVADCRKSMAKFATPGLRTALDATNLTNHPEVIRLMAKVGRALREDSTKGANGSPPPPLKDPKAVLKASYPSMVNPDGTLK